MGGLWGHEYEHYSEQVRAVKAVKTDIIHNYMPEEAIIHNYMPEEAMKPWV